MRYRFPKRATAVLAALAIPVFSIPAAADVPVTYTDHGTQLFTVQVPDFWEVRTGGPQDLTAPETGIAVPISRVLSLRPSVEPGVWIGFTVPEGVTTMRQAADYLRELGKFLSVDVTMSEPERRSIGGLPAYRSDGLGTRDGKDVQLTLAVIDLPGSPVAIVAVLTEVGIDASWYPLINEVINSFRTGG